MPTERNIGRLMLYLAIAGGFATIGILASSTLAPSKPKRAIHAYALRGRPSAITTALGGLWIADDADGVIRIIDTRTGKQDGAPIRVRRNPIAITAGDNSVFVGHANGDITRISATKRHVTSIVHAGGSITGLVSTHGRLWAADLQRAELLQLNPRSMRVVRRVKHLDAVRVIADSRTVWMTTAHDTAARYDIATGRVRQVHVGVGPIGLASDGRSVFVANSDDGTLMEIEGTTVIRKLKVGRGPVAVVIHNGDVWVANADDRSVMRIDDKTLVVTSVPVGTGVRGMVSAANLWLIGTDPSEVVRLSEPPRSEDEAG